MCSHIIVTPHTNGYIYSSAVVLPPGPRRAIFDCSGTDAATQQTLPPIVGLTSTWSLLGVLILHRACIPLRPTCSYGENLRTLVLSECSVVDAPSPRAYPLVEYLKCRVTAAYKQTNPRVNVKVAPTKPWRVEILKLSPCRNAEIIMRTCNPTVAYICLDKYMLGRLPKLIRGWSATTHLHLAAHPTVERSMPNFLWVAYLSSLKFLTLTRLGTVEAALMTGGLTLGHLEKINVREN